MPKFYNKKRNTKMNSHEFAAFIQEQAKDLKINSSELESATGQVLTNAIQERIKNEEPPEQLLSVIILLATIMGCFSISPEMFRDEHFLKALEKTSKMLEEVSP